MFLVKVKLKYVYYVSYIVETRMCTCLPRVPPVTKARFPLKVISILML